MCVCHYFGDLFLSRYGVVCMLESGTIPVVNPTSVIEQTIGIKFQFVFLNYENVGFSRVQSTAFVWSVHFVYQFNVNSFPAIYLAFYVPFVCCPGLQFRFVLGCSLALSSHSAFARHIRRIIVALFRLPYPLPRSLRVCVMPFLLSPSRVFLPPSLLSSRLQSRLSPSRPSSSRLPRSHELEHRCHIYTCQNYNNGK